MIIHQDYTDFGVTYDLVRSDERYIIRRSDGKEMYEDMQPKGQYTYTETDRKIDDLPVDENEQALKILLGEVS